MAASDRRLKLSPRRYQAEWRLLVGQRCARSLTVSAYAPYAIWILVILFSIFDIIRYPVSPDSFVVAMLFIIGPMFFLGMLTPALFFWREYLFRKITRNLPVNGQFSRPVDFASPARFRQWCYEQNLSPEGLIRS